MKPRNERAPRTGQGGQASQTALPERSHAEELAAISRRHLRFGWWGLLLFLTLGLVLETLHGFKVQWLLAADHETRRLLWRLAHAHGTLLSLVNIVFGLMLGRPLPWRPGLRSLASRALIAATILLPGGFFLGGVVVYGGDPGPGIYLVPFGALLLLVAVYLTARSTRHA
jgi:hypothetical protein